MLMAPGSRNAQPHHSQPDAPVSRGVSSLHEGQLEGHHPGLSMLSAATHDLELSASEQLVLRVHQPQAAVSRCQGGDSVLDMESSSTKSELLEEWKAFSVQRELVTPGGTFLRPV